MIQLQHLTIYRNHRKLLEDFSATIEKGSCVIFMGVNSSGKSSLLECLIGRLKPTRGQVLIDDRDSRFLSGKERKLLLQSSGIVFQTPSFGAYDTVSKVLSLASPEQLGAVLRHWNLLPDQLVRDLSFTEQRKLELERSFVNQSRLILWDEPFMGLDGASREYFLKRLGEAKDGGATIVVFTNQSDEFSFLNPDQVVSLS
ncbi:MAG: ATP-binding cassette domain-containing protein [bacterium]|nr:ATP-binding cassette domain-containing protein [bacterium]